MESVILAGGCFWCTEAVFRRLRGVESVMPGYAGGQKEDPTYKEVCSGTTGHAEAVKIDFDPAQLSFEDLLHVFFKLHDPTTLNRQGGDAGTQYRSAIFYNSDAQRETAERVIREVDAERIYPNPVVTEVTAFTNFYAAEDYHQVFYDRNQTYPYCSVVIDPKIQKLYRDFGSMLAEPARS